MSDFSIDGGIPLLSGQEFDQLVRKSFQQIAPLLVNYAKLLVIQVRAVDTGAYRDSWKADLEELVIYSNVDHAKYVEFGTKYMMDRPVLDNLIMYSNELLNTALDRNIQTALEAK